jgi:hypothetical protein
MPPRTAQQRRHPAIAITTILPRQRNDVLGQSRFVIRPARRFALCPSMLSEPRQTRRSDTGIFVLM